jgi:hypothetical protein
VAFIGAVMVVTLQIRPLRNLNWNRTVPHIGCAARTPACGRIGDRRCNSLDSASKGHSYGRFRKFPGPRAQSSRGELRDLVASLADIEYPGTKDEE